MDIRTAVVLVLILLAFFATHLLHASLILRGRALPGDKMSAFQASQRLTFWVGLLAALFLGLPPEALDGAEGPAVGVLLYVVASLLWALPAYAVARKLRGIPAEPLRFVLVDFGVRLFPAAPFLLWLLLASLLLALHLGFLLERALPAALLVASYLALVLFLGPHLLAYLFPATDPFWNRRARALAARAGVPFRRVAIIPTEPVGIPNAFVYGAGAGVIFVTDRLLEVLPPDEVEGVLAHELSHVRFRHTWKLGLFSLVLPLTAPSLPALGWLIFLVVLVLLYAVARRFEFQADQGAAELLGSGVPLAAALTHLVSLQEMPRRRRRRRRPLLATHPLPEERIRRLLGAAGP